MSPDHWNPLRPPAHTHASDFRGIDAEVCQVCQSYVNPWITLKRVMSYRLKLQQRILHAVAPPRAMTFPE